MTELEPASSYCAQAEGRKRLKNQATRSRMKPIFANRERQMNWIFSAIFSPAFEL
jgi:hypothetical protein